MSIKDQLKATPERGREITGHDLYCLERFAYDTKHMIVFDVLTWDCPIGEKDKRVRIYLTDEGYKQALESEGRGEMKIIRHAHVRKGDMYIPAPERDHEEY